MGLGYVLNPITNIFIKERRGRFRYTNTQGRRPQINGIKDWREAAVPRLAGSYQELGERNGIDSSSEPPEGINPGNSLISNFWSLELRENKFGCFIP